jgi:hypothetical protein
MAEGTITRITGGTFATELSGGMKIYTDTFDMIAGGKNNLGGAQGTNKGTPEKATAGNRVKEIELLTALDDGSANDGSGGLQKGIVLGKTYTFKVKSYTKTEAVNKNAVKWMIEYHNLTTGKWEKDYFDHRGEGIRIHFITNEMCGRFVYIRAYIEDEKEEGELKVWKHNRFRWFDRKNVHNQIAERVKEPWRINQGTTSLCGMACIFYLLVKKDGKGYEKLSKQLFRIGEHKYNDYLIEPHKDAHDMYDVNPYKDSDHPKLPEIDWITMSLVRSKESSLFGKILYKGKKNQDGAAINWPWLMEPLGKKLLGYTSVEMDYYKVNKSYVRDFFDSDEKIRILEKDIDADYKNGYEICMMIDGDMVSNKADYNITDLGEYHWIVYEGNLQMLNDKEAIESDYDEVSKIKFDIFTWGEEVRGKSRISNGISKKAFRNNYYGYLKLK